VAAGFCKGFYEKPPDLSAERLQLFRRHIFQLRRCFDCI